MAMSVGDTTSCGALKPLIDDGPKSPAIVGGSATLQPATTATTAPAKRSLIRMPEQETENVPPNGGWLELVDPNLRLLAMGDGRWAMGDGRWAMGDGRWAMGDGRWAMTARIALAVTAHTRAMVLADGSSTLLGLPWRHARTQPRSPDPRRAADTARRAWHPPTHL